MLNGVNVWRAAGFLGMSVETLFGHHHPDFMADAADAIGRKPNKNQSLVVSLVGDSRQRKKNPCKTKWWMQSASNPSQHPDSLANREINSEFCRIRAPSEGLRDQSASKINCL
jgi:hypothetical protein